MLKNKAPKGGLCYVTDVMQPLFLSSSKWLDDSAMHWKTTEGQ